MLTSAGRLPFQGIIHVAGIGLLWTASPRSVALSVRNAMAVACDQGFRSVAFPLIGAGTGALRADTVTELMLETLEECDFQGEVRVIRYRECQPVSAG